nr:unnamed protein product [Callosobruchus chinensis]
MIWHEHVSWIATAAGRKLGYLFRARKYFSPSNLLTLYKDLDWIQRRAIRLIGDPALTCHLQPLSHRRAVGDLSLFYRYSNGSELTSVIPPLSKPARCTHGTSSSHPKTIIKNLCPQASYISTVHCCHVMRSTDPLIPFALKHENEDERALLFREHELSLSLDLRYQESIIEPAQTQFKAHIKTLKTILFYRYSNAWTLLNSS